MFFEGVDTRTRGPDPQFQTTAFSFIVFVDYVVNRRFELNFEIYLLINSCQRLVYKTYPTVVCHALFKGDAIFESPKELYQRGRFGGRLQTGKIGRKFRNNFLKNYENISE